MLNVMNQILYRVVLETTSSVLARVGFMDIHNSLGST